MFFAVQVRHELSLLLAQPDIVKTKTINTVAQDSCVFFIIKKLSEKKRLGKCYLFIDIKSICCTLQLQTNI